MMQPLQITAHLAGSIAISRPEDISLDGLLAYQILRRHFGQDFYSLPDPKEVLYFARLPLEMRGQPLSTIERMQTGDVWYSHTSRDESFWYWACSTAQIVAQGRDTQYWNKRFDTQPNLSKHIDFGGRVEKVLIEQGRYKAYHMPLATMVTDRIVWYAVGDAEMIARLLSPITAIGKKHAQGQGHVLRWEVEPIAEDYSEWKDGRLMRPIPGPLVRNMHPLDMQHIAFRAPQWHVLNQAMCVTKGIRV
jgi:CRISPR type IV-associated protein Csf3